ncbi:hypothetical protein L249_2376 [Ophiocordyceps polyrhachis-furcata BCC 54312]|uniref:Uncharacterized protein n=1 Tax=Ophiocordyceps polyrhachis-furcata BCC 54312 TaxID=1330021 RepID=A0A367LP60_9HYPO|nr:hypothetical protein L249_2376 [Ophiocordyceps polyrhachis-furcata BCC 54312]
MGLVRPRDYEKAFFSDISRNNLVSSECVVQSVITKPIFPLDKCVQANRIVVHGNIRGSSWMSNGPELYGPDRSKVQSFIVDAQSKCVDKTTCRLISKNTRHMTRDLETVPALNLPVSWDLCCSPTTRTCLYQKASPGFFIGCVEDEIHLSFPFLTLIGNV